MAINSQDMLIFIHINKGINMKKFIIVLNIILISIIGTYILMNLWQIHSYECRKEQWCDVLTNNFEQFDYIIRLLEKSENEISSVEINQEADIIYRNQTSIKKDMDFEQRLVNEALKLSNYNIDTIINIFHGYTLLQTANGQEYGLQYNIQKNHTLVSHLQENWFFYDTSYDIAKENKLCRIIYNLFT